MNVHIFYEDGQHFNISHINKYELTVERSSRPDESRKIPHIQCLIKGELKKIMKRDNHTKYNTCILDLPEEQARILAQNILNVLENKAESARKTLIDESCKVKTIDVEPAHVF